MAFYVYENWQAGPHKTVIHGGSCGHCIEGEGRTRGYDPRHAQWHGAFPLRNDGREISESIHGVVIRKEG